jgi:putative inorganic carbon (hco3(-)) transporter
MTYFVLILLFIVEYVRPSNLFPVLNVLRVNTMVPLLVILATVLVASRVSFEQFLSEKNTRLMLAWLGLIGFSLITAGVTTYAFDKFTVVFGYFFFYWAIVKSTTSLGRIKGLFAVLIFMHIYLALLTPEMFLDSTQRHYLRSGTFLGDGNDYALSVNIALPFCLFMVFDSRGFVRRAFWGGCLAMLVLCIIGTQSRGGTIALGAVAAYYWLKSERKAVLGGLAAAGLVGVLIAAPPQYFARMNTMGHVADDGSAQGRLTAWKAGTLMALYSPLWGVGAGNFPNNFTRYAPGLEGGGRWKTAHSIYFLQLGELGVPGLALLITFIVSNLMSNRRLSKRIPATLPDRATCVNLLVSMSAGMLAYAVAGAFLSAAYYPHIFVLFGLSVAARRYVCEGLAATVELPTPAKSTALVRTSPVFRMPKGRYAS